MHTEVQDGLKGKQTKRERFVRIVERRVNKIIDGLDSLGKCSNKRNYKYSDEDVRVIFGELEGKLREVRTMFKDTTEKKRFKLGL